MICELVDDANFHFNQISLSVTRTLRYNEDFMMDLYQVSNARWFSQHE